MTIEASIRRRAARSRRIALLWTLLAIAILAATFTLLPQIAQQTFLSATAASSMIETSGIDTPNAEVVAVATLVIAILVVFLAVFILAKVALIEAEAASRYLGLADALCLAGGDINQLEKAVTILVPQSKQQVSANLLLFKEIKPYLDLIRPK